MTQQNMNDESNQRVSFSMELRDLLEKYEGRLNTKIIVNILETAKNNFKKRVT